MYVILTLIRNSSLESANSIANFKEVTCNVCFQTELLLAVVEDENNVQEDRQEMAETLLNALSDRQQHRQTWRDR